MKTLLEKWIYFQHHQTLLFIALCLTLFGIGGWVSYNSEIQAFPEFTNVQVQIITQYPGKAAEEVERQITQPLEVASNGISGLINQRSISIFGLSVITLTFDDNVKTKQARLDVFQRLSTVELPQGITPSLSPESTPVGEIFRYSLEGEVPLDEQRLLEDWTLEREFKSIPGVADVVSFGGPMRTIEIKINMGRLSSMGLKLDDVAEALSFNHANAGGSMITHGDEAYLVRSLGLYEKPENLEAAVVGTHHNTPIRVQDIGSVLLGHRMRLGQVGRGTINDVVEGIILLRQGSDTLDTCKKIREKISALNHGILPQGVLISPYYDRTQLIERASHTVFHNILFGIFLVVLILILGLGLQFWPLILGVALIIPFALLMAFSGVNLFGYAPNLISLGAVDFGIIVETAIFASEAVILALLSKKKNNSEVISTALSKVLGPAFLCALLLLIAFIPILSLGRVEGRIFRPLGITLVSALVGGQIGALFFVPAFASLCPSQVTHKAFLDRFFEGCIHSCQCISSFLAKQKKLFTYSFIFFLLLILSLTWNLGREFLPQLNEGALWIRATAPQTISRESASELALQIRQRLMTIPEVKDVISQTGRPDDGTDINGFDNIEFFVVLDSPEHWESASSIEGFIKLGEDKLKVFPGIQFNFSQPIKDNVDEAISGVKGELVVKVFGPKLEELQNLALQIKDIVQSVPGAQDVGVEQLLGSPELQFNMNRDLLARYGLRVTDAESILESALLGKYATKMMDEFGRYIDILVKPDIPDNPSLDTLSNLPLLTPDGARIPLGDVANPKLVEGVSRIYRELGERRIAVKSSVRDRAVVEFVKEANLKINQQVKLPPHYHLEWAGAFENAERAAQQLMLIVPLCFAFILLILYSWFGNFSSVLLLLWEIPFGLVGGLGLLRFLGLNLSISASAGAIVLMGVTFLTGMMLISRFNHNGSAHESLADEGRAILISSGVAIVGLIPAAFSHGIGAETARPFAVMILGGLVTSLFFSLILLPAFLKKKEFSKKEEQAA
ncbi:MAG: efflux RND transporter permease subunit [Deltaproteobacteria bacterium]|nr:efflux RND transporter permease subunit [Deltaproteobacteria bacterium]